MRARSIVLVLFGVVGIAVLLLRPTAPEAPGQKVQPPGATTRAEDGTRDLDASRRTAPVDDPSVVSALVGDPSAELDAARSALASARETLREAERQLDDLEREVEAVEQFVENIEERGEDPARYAFEGMEQLNPVIERYEARLATVLEAEEAVAAAETRVRRAQAAVEGSPATE